MSEPIPTTPAELDARYAELLERGRALHPGLNIGKPVRSRGFWPVILTLRLVRVPVEVEMSGQELLGDGPAIIVSNHQGALDPVVATCRTWWHVIAFTKVEWFESRLGFFFRWFAQVPLRRGDDEATEWALDMCAFALDDGLKVGIYPEGTRGPSRTSVYRFHQRVLVPILTARPDVPVHACAVTYPETSGWRKKAVVRFSEALPLDARTMSGDELTRVIRDEVARLGGLTMENTYAFVAKAKADREAARGQDAS